MKTAIQELIEELKKRRDLIREAYKPLNHLVGVNNLRDIMIDQINHDIYLASSMLQKEQEQIVNAYKEGCSDSILDESTDEERAEEYYNETYNPDRDENGRI